ncbi:MAG: ABC transporter permease [Acidimicrobiales bacterium]
MSQFLSYALPGIPFGCAYALLALGLVLTFKASGVFNIAFGAQAYVAALVFDVAVENGWPRWAAFIVAVVLLSPAIGIALDRALFRSTHSAPPLVKLVPSLGLLIAIPSITQMIFGISQRLAPPALALNPDAVEFRVARVAVTGSEVLTTLVTAGVVIVLALIFSRSPIGLEMRAVVESARMTELDGIRADRVSAFAWVLSSLLAGLAGVLLAPDFATLDPSNFTALLVAAIAAGAIGGFASLPLTLAGGLVLGVAQEVIGGYLPSGSVLASGLRPSFPFLVLGVLLVAGRRFRPTGVFSDPLAVVDPPAPSLRPPGRMEEVALGSRAFMAFAAAVVFVLAAVVLPGNWEFTLTQGVVLATILLSITLLTGLSGQISLCQAAFVAVGAFTAAQLAVHFNTAILIGALAGGALAAVVGGLIALPGLRLGGIALAIFTLSFALLCDNVLFQYSWSGNGASGLLVPRPEIGGLNFTGNTAFLLLSVVVLAIAAIAVRLVQRSTLGGELVALRSSEVGAQSIGIDVRRLRIVAFVLSAAVAGVGGGLYASLEQGVSPSDFNYEFSLLFVVIVAIVGVYSVTGAIVGGIAYAVINQAVSSLPTRFDEMLALIFGVAALSYVRHPEGIVEFGRRWILDRAEQFAHYLNRAGESGSGLATESGKGAG